MASGLLLMQSECINYWMSSNGTGKTILIGFDGQIFWAKRGFDVAMMPNIKKRLLKTLVLLMFISAPMIKSITLNGISKESND